MRNYIYGGALTLLFMGAVLVPNAQAETTPSTSMLEQIQALMAKVEELQKQLATLRGEIKEIIRVGIAEGTTGDDITKIQELLATDPTIYPEGRVTGYYGNLTKEAIKRLQARHELEITGVIDEATRDLLESYLKERFGEDIPPGLLRAPGIAKKVEIRIKEGCDNSGKGKALFCEKLRIKYEGGDDEDEDSEDEDSDEFEVEIESEDDGDTIAFKFEGEEYSLELDSLLYGDILRTVADALDTTVPELDRDLKDEIKSELEDELEDEDEDEDEDEEDTEDDSDDDSDDDEDDDSDDDDEDDD